VTRAKPRRAGTRSGRRAESLITDAMPIKKAELPADLADAAEAALDDLLNPDRSASFSLDGDADDFEAATAPSRDLSRDLPRARAKPPAPPPKAHAKRPKTIAPPPLEEPPILEEQVLPQIPQLRFAIYEQVEQLASAQGAIVAAGHVVVVGASGTAGWSKVADQIVAGVDAVLVALPGGEPVIDIALAQEPRRPIIIASITGKPSEGCARAIAAGADLASARPHELERMSPILLAAARLHAERRLAQNARGAEAVLRAKLEELSDPDPRGLQPMEVFQRVIELELKRARRFGYPLSVALLELGSIELPAGGDRILRARATAAIVGAVRDIDLITELEDGRLLVLLPYTDLDGAENVGVRLVHAVRSQPPVTIGEVSAGAELRIGVAGGRIGERLSFARLMKDANAALAQAHADLLDLVVHA